MDLKSLNLSQDQLLQLKEQLDGLASASNRSPFRPRQLHDLRLMPTADDPRPTFFMSAESPRNVADLGKTEPYPRLMWEAATGREVTVNDVAEQQAHLAQGFVLEAPGNAEAPDLAETIRLQLEALSPEDRKTLILAAQGDKLARLRESMAGLSEADLATFMASVEPSKARKSA